MAESHVVEPGKQPLFLMGIPPILVCGGVKRRDQVVYQVFPAPEKKITGIFGPRESFAEAGGSVTSRCIRSPQAVEN